ncbi:hypothetical protein QTH97_33070 [Variovorax sp. J22R24]|uniref:hypothetical protein n=1 Tax=Variovorax gracilis TaxID=3053502 RepID=UPI002575AFCF|nr:hypothetical protein [Variovorax sp. J22R24]MDM0109789.1 hypothetical protein [Variovorax sp. J22R24]
MASIAVFESREAKLNKDISTQVDKILAATPIKLPEPDAEISKLYVKKIEGTYNVDRAKTDTDHAIDLLYIAYNTTPQKEGAIRVKIGDIMNSLITAQQDSEVAMSNAMKVSDFVIGKLGNIHADWLDVRKVDSAENTKGVEEIKEFLKSDILDLATNIKTKALGVKKELDGIAATYAGIIKRTVEATSTSEKALSSELKDKAAIEKEINESTAKREQLDALVKDLQLEVEKYDKKARDYEGRANTAEERAFIMSIVQIGAQMLAGALPAIVTAVTASATGGASIVASAAASTVNRTLGDKNADVKPDASADEQIISKKKELSQKQAEADVAEKKITALKGDIKGLDNELKKEEAKDKAPKEKDPKDKEAAAAEPDKKEESETAKELKGRIKEKKEELKTEEDKYAVLIGVLSGLQASLTALDKGLGKMTEKLENTAAGLREMQMKMLDKVETYEKERRTQNAELVKINALLKGKRDDQETIKLTIRSLNLSISALKRAKEIIEEIAFFFKSFADFMDRISQETELDIALFNEFAKKEKIRENYFKNLIQGGDKFFVREQAEWNAVRIVCDRFCKSFADGWSKLNKLSGRYIEGKELDAYFVTASAKLEQIVSEREAAAKQKILDLDGYRKELRDSAMA